MDCSFLIKKYQDEVHRKPKDPSSLFNLALLYCEARDYQMASTTFTKVTSLDPSLYIVYFYSGIAYACNGKPELAGLEWEMYLKHNPTPFDEREPQNFPFEFNEAVHVKKALTECLQRKKLLPDDIHSIYHLALAYVVTHQFMMARRELEDLITKHPNFTKAYFMLVEIYLKQKELGRAIDALKKLTRAEPGSYVAHFKLGQLLVQQNDVSTAVPVLQKALSLKPNTDIIYIELGKAYRLQSKEEFARSSFKRALELNPNSAEAYFELGVLSEEKFDFNAAIDNYQKAIRIDDARGDAYSHLGDIYKRQGKIHMAIENLEKSVRFFPQDAYLHYQLGEAYLALKMYREAVKELKEAVKCNPKDIYSFLNLAIALSRSSQLEESLVTFKKVLELKPDFIEPYYHMALTYLKMSHLTFARECIEKFLSVKPNDTYAHFALGNIHLRFGDLDQAIVEYKKAIDSYPDHPYARFNLASSYARAGQFTFAEEEFSKAMEHNTPDSEDEMILFATMASYHSILQTLAKAMTELRTSFQLYEDAKNKYLSEEKIKNRIAELFKKVLPETVAEELITDGGGELEDEQKEVTVVFSDIRGYTTLTEAIGPRNAMKVLNDFYRSTSKISNKYGGTLLYFQGDAQMIIFGAMKDDKDHPLSALKAAIDMKQQVSLLSDKWFRDQQIKFEIAVGITTGEVVLGFINDGDRIQYTAIGDTVNVASRLQDVSKAHNSAVMLNEKAYEKVKQHVKAEKLESIALKGKTETLDVYKIESFIDPETTSFNAFIKEALSVSDSGSAQ
jgi:tetratricopeptide (TPR) repeat protein